MAHPNPRVNLPSLFGLWVLVAYTLWLISNIYNGTTKNVWSERLNERLYVWTIATGRNVLYNSSSPLLRSVWNWNGPGGTEMTDGCTKSHNFILSTIQRDVRPSVFDCLGLAVFVSISLPCLRLDDWQWSSVTKLQTDKKYFCPQLSVHCHLKKVYSCHTAPMASSINFIAFQVWRHKSTTTTAKKSSEWRFISWKVGPFVYQYHCTIVILFLSALRSTCIGTIGGSDEGSSF